MVSLATPPALGGASRAGAERARARPHEIRGLCVPRRARQQTCSGMGEQHRPAPSSSAFACFVGRCLFRRRAVAPRDTTPEAMTRQTAVHRDRTRPASRRRASTGRRALAGAPLRDPISARGSSAVGAPDRTPSHQSGGATLELPIWADYRSWTYPPCCVFFGQHTA